jgi:hypothetical protein
MTCVTSFPRFAPELKPQGRWNSAVSIAPVPPFVNHHPELAVSNLVKSLHSSEGSGAGWGMVIDSLIRLLICTAFSLQAAKGGRDCMKH